MGKHARHRLDPDKELDSSVKAPGYLRDGPASGGTAQPPAGLRHRKQDRGQTPKPRSGSGRHPSLPSCEPPHRLGIARRHGGTAGASIRKPTHARPVSKRGLDAETAPGCTRDQRVQGSRQGWEPLARCSPDPSR
jgi:hypothetical protein